MDGADGMVLLSQRRAEERHHPVAGEGIEPAPVALHLPGDEGEAPVHDLVDDLRVEPFRQRGETDDIGEEDRDLSALTPPTVELWEALPPPRSPRHNPRRIARRPRC